MPHAWEIAGRPVEDDRAAHEHEAANDVLDGAELVRDVQDRDTEIAPQLVEEDAERSLRLGVDTRRRLVEGKERGL